MNVIGCLPDKSWQLDEDRVAIIDKNLHELIRLLDVDEDLLVSMESTKCLSRRHLNHIRATEKINRNLELLNMLKRRSANHFSQFVSCLEKTQRYLVPLLTGNIGNFMF